MVGLPALLLPPVFFEWFRFVGLGREAQGGLQINLSFGLVLK